MAILYVHVCIAGMYVVMLYDPNIILQLNYVGLSYSCLQLMHDNFSGQ